MASAEGVLEADCLRGRTSPEAPQSEPYLPSHCADTCCGGEARLGTESLRSIHEVVDVPSNRGGLDPSDVPGLHGLALGDDVRDRRHELIDISSVGRDLRLVAVASGENTCAAEQDCERAASHGRVSLAWRAAAAPRLSAGGPHAVPRLELRSRLAVLGCAGLNRLSLQESVQCPRSGEPELPGPVLRPAHCDLQLVPGDP